MSNLTDTMELTIQDVPIDFLNSSHYFKEFRAFINKEKSIFELDQTIQLPPSLWQYIMTNVFGLSQIMSNCMTQKVRFSTDAMTYFIYHSHHFEQNLAERLSSFADRAFTNPQFTSRFHAMTVQDFTASLPNISIENMYLYSAPTPNHRWYVSQFALDYAIANTLNVDELRRFDSTFWVRTTKNYMLCGHEVCILRDFSDPQNIFWFGDLKDHYCIEYGDAAYIVNIHNAPVLAAHLRGFPLNPIYGAKHAVHLR